MSWDLDLTDPITGDTLELDSPHHMKGGTYCVGGETHATLNVTYNYSAIYQRVMDGGLSSIEGVTGADSIPILNAAIEKLGDDVDADYWKATEGNAKRALRQLAALAKLRPDGVWRLH